MPSADSSEKKFKTYFEKDQRKKKNEAVSFDFVKECYKNTFSLELFSHITNIEQHSFYKTLHEVWFKQSNGGDNQNVQANANSNVNGKPKQDVTGDEVFATYLKEVGGQSNTEYFHFVFKFVVLFRECINRIKKDSIDPLKQTEEKKEYMQVHTAEAAPDTCNEFITEFMEPNDYFGLDTSELIEIIQHLCYWLYANNYTTSRLTLL